MKTKNPEKASRMIGKIKRTIRKSFTNQHLRACARMIENYVDMYCHKKEKNKTRAELMFRIAEQEAILIDQGFSHRPYYDDAMVSIGRHQNKKTATLPAA